MPQPALPPCPAHAAHAHPRGPGQPLLLVPPRPPLGPCTPWVSVVPPEYDGGDERGLTGLALADYVTAQNATRSDRADRLTLLGRILQQTSASHLHWPQDEARIRRLKDLRPRFLDASNLRALTELPTGLSVIGELRLCNNLALRHLPACLQVGESLTIQTCPMLRSVPSFGGAQGCVSVVDCAQLTTLPKSARLRGNCTVIDCPELVALPVRLDVQGTITVARCPRLKTLSQELSVGAELTVSECPSLVCIARAAQMQPHTGVSFKACKKLLRLPDSVEQVRALVLEGCGPFRIGDHLRIEAMLTLIDTPMPKFGAHFRLQGGLKLVGRSVRQPIPQPLWTLPSLRIERGTVAHLPKQLAIINDLTILDSVMPKMHRRLRVGGRVVIERCTGSKFFAPRMHIGGDLILKDCSQVRKLRRALRVGGNFCAERCPKLTSLGTHIELGRDVSIHGGVVPELTRGTVITGTLALVQCHQGAALPRELVCNQDLILEECDAIKRLPDNLVVRGNLYAGYLPNLTALGKETLVHGSTEIEACEALSSLGQGCVLGAHNDEVQLEVLFAGCPSLHTLPDSIERWRCASLFLRGSGLPIETCHTLSLRTPNMVWWVDGVALHVDAWQPGHETDAADARRALFEARAPWSLTPHKALIDSFLAAVSQTADFTHAGARAATFLRLVHIFTAMADDEALAQRCLELMADSLTSCEDRTIFGLDEMEIAVRVHQALGQADSAQALESLGLRLLKLDVVRRHAALACQELAQASVDEVDAIEVYLCFSTQLRERLDLPISTQGAMYGAEVSDEQLAWAADEAEYAAADAAIRAEWLNAWAPWQAHQRHRALLPYERITVRHDVSETQPLRCVITLAEAAEMLCPVYLGEDDARRLYDYEALSVWYVQQGTDPSNRMPLQLADLYRMPDGGDVRQAAAPSCPAV